MRDADWSRPNLLRSDWLGPQVAICTTFVHLILVSLKMLDIIFFYFFSEKYYRDAIKII